jgi:hypothetical protein
MSRLATSAPCGFADTARGQKLLDAVSGRDSGKIRE